MNPFHIHIRKAQEEDLNQIAMLFYETITTVNSKDYNTDQIKLWSSRDVSFWNRRFGEQYFIVAERADEMVGFASLTDSGYLDFMYVHKNHQRKGIARALLNVMEQRCVALGLSQMNSHISITARPFFENAGFILMRGPQKQKKINAISLTNYAMKKEIIFTFPS